MAWTENYIRRRFLSDEGVAFTLLFLFENVHGLLSSLLATRRSFFAWQIPPRRSFSTKVTAGADLGKGHSPSEILNRNERLFSAFYLFPPQRICLKDSIVEEQRPKKIQHRSTPTTQKVCQQIQIAKYPQITYSTFGSTNCGVSDLVRCDFWGGWGVFWSIKFQHFRTGLKLWKIISFYLIRQMG